MADLSPIQKMVLERNFALISQKPCPVCGQIGTYRIDDSEYQLQSRRRIDGNLVEESKWYYTPLGFIMFMSCGNCYTFKIPNQ